MSKTLSSMIHEAELKADMWNEISEDDTALADRGKTKNEACNIASYFVGVVDGLIRARDNKDWAND